MGRNKIVKKNPGKIYKKFKFSPAFNFQILEISLIFKKYNFCQNAGGGAFLEVESTQVHPNAYTRWVITVFPNTSD